MEYLYTKTYLVSMKQKLVLPIAFKSGVEALDYADQHNLRSLGYNLIMKGGDVIRTLKSGRINEPSHPEGGSGESRDGVKGMTIPKETSYKEYTPKPAWQMTREEYYKPVTLPQGWKNKGYKAIIQKPRGKIGELTAYIVRVITPDGETLYPADHLGLTYIRAKYKEDHRMKVKDALERGLPVPPQVLADYPDLQPRRGEPTKLPEFRGYTIDKRLREFRKFEYGKTVEFIPFDSPKGQKIIHEMQIEGVWKPDHPAITPSVSKFPLGMIVMTRGVADEAATNSAFAAFETESLKRHANGDWGDLSAEDKKENEYSLNKHLRLFSAYEKKGLPKIWVITESDRSVTTILFPSEY